MIRLINALLAIIGGVGAALLLYWVLNKLVEMLPQKWEERLKPWVFAGVALAAIGLFLIYPAIRTIIPELRQRHHHGLGRAGELHRPAHLP